MEADGADISDPGGRVLTLMLDSERLSLLFPAYLETDRDLTVVGFGPSVSLVTAGVGVGAPLSRTFVLQPAGAPADLARARTLVRLATPDGAPRLQGLVVETETGFLFLANVFVAATDALERERDEAVAASRAKSDFLGQISRELRTQLHGVIGVIGQLASSRLTPEQAELVELIQGSGDALTDVVDEVLDFVRQETQPVSEDARALDLSHRSQDGPPSARTAAAAVAEGADDDDDSPVRALVAEDHPANRRIIELMLAPMGVEVTLVGNGAEAVEAFKQHDWEMVLLDMQMPVLDGASAARAMRGMEPALGRGRTPIAMLSANVLPRHVEDALAAGADHFIAKPVTPAALARGLDELIRAAAVNAAKEA